MQGVPVYYKRDDNINGNTVGGISVPAFYSLACISKSSPCRTELLTRNRLIHCMADWLFPGIDLIYLEATGRNDWSSTLPVDTKSYFYPSVSGSFVISQLMPGTKSWLDLLKVRSSWTVSKTPPAIYACQ